MAANPIELEGFASEVDEAHTPRPRDNGARNTGFGLVDRTMEFLAVLVTS